MTKPPLPPSEQIRRILARGDHANMLDNNDLRTFGRILMELCEAEEKRQATEKDPK